MSKTKSHEEEESAWRTFLHAHPIKDWDDDKIEELLTNVFLVHPKLMERKRTQEVNEKVRQYHIQHTNEGVLITVCIDQKIEGIDAVEAQQAVIKELQNANYMWLIEAKAVFEYYSKDKWNPHIHICVKRSVKESVIRQHLARKFKNKKHGVYRFDVEKHKDYSTAEEYIHGRKVDEKLDSVKKDKEFRQAHSIDDVIVI